MYAVQRHMPLALNPEKARIFRVTHRDNLPWIMAHGLHASSAQLRDPNYRNIGNLDLIDKRSRRFVTVGPGGTLSDYVPFYFTPFSVMMFNIHTGYNVRQVPNEEIVILVSSMHKVAELDLKVSRNPLEVSGGSLHLTLPPLEPTLPSGPRPPSASTGPGNP